MTNQVTNNEKIEYDHGRNEVILFWGCFFALIATAFGFIVRSQIIGEWEVQFNLSETQKGEILGVGLWPFAISIVLFSLIVDKVGYGKAMVFAFACHALSAIITITAKNYQMLYWGVFIFSLGCGTVEAVINPVVATLFPREKTKWLSILHAGWPGGLVLGGMLAIYLGDVDWTYKIALIFIPMAIYAYLLVGRRFPIHERVAAGVSYREMLAEAGFIGALIVLALMVRQLGVTFTPENATNETIKLSNWIQLVVGLILFVPYAIYVRSPGRPMFIFLVLIMIPLATTELGTDSWITDLMTPVMEKMTLHPGWVLVYTSFIMMVLRFFAGPIVKRISPLGLLAVSAAVAAVGLFLLSTAAGIAILVAATIYGFGKTFFWPTMLGVVSEQFPKGGALTINLIAGVGMLGVGIVGSVFLGNIQDKAVDRNLLAEDATLHEEVMGKEKYSVFGKYRAIDQEKLEGVAAEDTSTIDVIREASKKGALKTVAIFPVIMLICYLILIAYFRSTGGYRAEELVGHAKSSKASEA